MARVDFFLEKKGGKLYLNEVNTIPGLLQSACIQSCGSYGNSLSRIDRPTDYAGSRSSPGKARTKYEIELPEGAGGALEG